MLRGPCPESLCISICTSRCGLARYDIAQKTAFVLLPSMSLSTATIHLPPHSAVRRTAVHGAPDFRLRRALLELNHHQLMKRSKRFMKDHLVYALDAKALAQMLHQPGLVTGPPDSARFARCHLAHP